jgi:hypothetical protein
MVVINLIALSLPQSKQIILFISKILPNIAAPKERK